MYDFYFCSLESFVLSSYQGKLLSLSFIAVSIGIKHPDPVVETSSLASVEPSNIWYNLSLPENIVDNGELSALQLEAVTYACQRHDIIMPSKERAGFLIGKYSSVCVCFTFLLLV